MVSMLDQQSYRKMGQLNEKKNNKDGDYFRSRWSKLTMFLSQMIYKII